MRHQHHLTLIAIGTLGLLAACSNQEPGAVTEADVAAKRAELERLEADLAAQQNPAPSGETETAPAPAAAPPPAATGTSTGSSRPASASTAATKPAASRPASTASQPSRPAAPQSITVPAGTELQVALVTPLSTKTSKVGEQVHARVTRDVLVDGHTAIPQGLNVAGSVVKVVSGSEKIGGTPGLLIAFERIELPNGDDVPIAGEFEEKGKSDNTRDAVKIVGGAAAGTLLADQISKKDRNRVIGGIIGAAAGAVAARETGTEVQIAEGTTLTLVLSAPVEMPRN